LCLFTNLLEPQVDPEYSESQNFSFLYETWKVLVSLAKLLQIFTFQDLHIFKTNLERKFFLSPSRGVAGVAGVFGMKFEAQLAQPR
jgi:hypothetical protein